MREENNRQFAIEAKAVNSMILNGILGFIGRVERVFKMEFNAENYWMFGAVFKEAYKL